MKQIYTYSIIIFFLLTCNSKSIAQYNNNNNNSFNQSIPYISAIFSQENVIIDSESTLFNVLIVENKGEKREELFIEINVPFGWSVFALEDRSYHLNPGDSVLIPVRAAPSKSVEGNIGYSLIAAINNRDGETYTNAYCFIKIKRHSDLRFRPITRVGYFDQQTGESELSFRLSNRGNISEIAYLNFQSTRNVSIINERDNLFNMDVLISARSDTIITLPVRMADEHNLQNGSLFRVDLKGHTLDRTFGTSFWFNHLVSNYKYVIPETEKILIAEIALQNLLSEQPAIISGGFRGNVLFPQKRDINYTFYRHGSAPTSDLLKYSRTRFTYNSPSLSASIGDVSGMNLRYGGGKGMEVTYRAPSSLHFTAIANKNSFRPITNYGFAVDERISPFNLGTQFAYSENKFLDNTAYVAGAKGRVRFAQNHNIRADFGLSNANYNVPQTTAFGYGLNLDYSGRFNNTTIRVREQLGSSDYYGSYSGRHNFVATVNHPFESGYNVDLSINDQRFRPLIETVEGIESDKYLDNRIVNLIARKSLDQGLQVYAGPVYHKKSTNTFYFFDNVNPFTSHSAKATVGTRINESQGFSFNPSVTFGYTFITDYSIPDPEIFQYNIANRDTEFFNSLVTINFRSNYWGAYINYFYGPYSVNQEITQFYYNISAHSVRVMPYYEKFIYKDMVMLSSKLSYTYDFAFKTSRLNLGNQLDVFLPHDFKVSLLNTYNYQLTTDLITEDKFSYSSLYFELRVSKEFNWNQPRVRYYDLEINLFKDLNGNLIREPNEPGVKEVLVSITSIEQQRYEEFGVFFEAPQRMVSIKLLSGMDGIIRYENLPRGIYSIKLESVGTDQDKYFPDESEFIVILSKDETLFIPYLERNKIFGRVIMNRSRLSTLGRIDVGNIKITAIDSKDRETSTLTDAFGKFEMYVPSIDHYIVSINNIFRDHFNLRQNDFRANLNGFKQFEVNFVFDEIRRHIEFTPTPTDIEAEIRRVGRTNLSGIVRDASTLRPIRAQIEIIDNKTGNNIAQTVSDRSTGRYSASFITGEDYYVLVSASGYWVQSERLTLDQFLTIQDAERDVLLENIAIGARFQLSNLVFAPGSVDIPTEAYPELDRLINQLRDNPNVRIRIEGHSDPVETLDDKSLSVRRAEVIMRYMVQNGFSNIEFTGLEDSQPLAPSDTEENRRRNRRVEIIIVDR